MNGFTEADVARFMSYVDKLPCGCWFWTGARSRGGGDKKQKAYGSFRVAGKTVRAHTFACEALGGKPCPPGHHRDHTCRFSLCVNPDHLEIVTAEENERRKQAWRASIERLGVAHVSGGQPGVYVIPHLHAELNAEPHPGNSPNQVPFPRDIIPLVMWAT